MERTTFAYGSAPAVKITGANDEGMQFVIVLSQFASRHAAHARDGMARIRAEFLHCELLRRGGAKRLLDEKADLVIFGFCRDDAVALEDATSIGIHDKDRMVAGVKQDGVGGFRAHAIQGQQFCTQLCSGLSEHSVERAGIVQVEEPDKGFQLLRLLPEVTGRSNKLL